MRRFVFLLLLLVACGSSDPAPAPGVSARMNWGAVGDDFWAAPFPSDQRMVDGRVDMGAFPNPDGIPFVSGMMSLLEDADGFAQTGGIFFPLTGAIDPATLPSLEQSITPEATVYLADESGKRMPVTVRYTAEDGPFTVAHMLSILPLQGIPLAPRTTYTAVVTDAVTSERAETTFTTWDATEEMRSLLEHARAEPLPAPLSAWAQTDVFDEYCVYQTSVNMPVYQVGEPPFQELGGGIAFNNGVPELVGAEEARIYVTIPRTTMPADGWPTALMVRTGGGGDRPLVDRGVRDAAGAVAIPGTGPALHFTRAGYAGITVDGPHGGIRNVTGGDEQFLMFNIGNPEAMVDNIRQSAVELALMADVIETLSVDTSDCLGASAQVTFDTATLAIMGHSMGATISPLTLAVEPRYRAVILSGAGGSWIENVVHKQSPVPVKPLAEVLLYYPTHQRDLHEHDPVLSMLQWVGEPADPPVYGEAIIDHGTHVLMLQGIVDTYILPPIANATTLSLGLNLAGEALDVDHPELTQFRPARDVLPFSGADMVSLPTAGNVVVQHAEDPIEDGHEVAFQTQAPKHQYRCFLASLLTGAPTTDASAAEDAPCP